MNVATMFLQKKIRENKAQNEEENEVGANNDYLQRIAARVYEP